MHGVELINKLERMNKGANVHTINKTIFYLKQSDCEFLIYLTDLARKSYISGDWSIPKRLLRSYF